MEIYLHDEDLGVRFFTNYLVYNSFSLFQDSLKQTKEIIQKRFFWVHC